MTNPFGGLGGPIRDLHALAGHEGQLINYSASTSTANNWYDETDSSEFDALDPEPITIRVERSTRAQSGQTAGGVEIDTDVVVFIDPSEVSEVVESGDDKPASVIIDPSGPSDTHYRVVRVDDDGSGLWLAQCERIEDES